MQFYRYEELIEKLRSTYDPRYVAKLDMGSEAMRLGYLLGAWDTIDSVKAFFESEETEDVDVLGK